jgi:hypothetical protein
MRLLSLQLTTRVALCWRLTWGIIGLGDTITGATLPLMLESATASSEQGSAQKIRPG